MEIEYADLLSGEAILLENAGHFRSPFLYELKPTSGIGWFKYSLLLSVFIWDKPAILKVATTLGMKGLKAFEGKDNLSRFDIMVLIQQTKTLLQEALSFFMVEKVIWQDSAKAFYTLNKAGEMVGKIDRKNFEDVCSVIMQLNCVQSKKTADEEMKFQSDNAREMWERVQKFKEKEESQQSSAEQANYTLGNIISKLCCVHSSYNLLNVYDLTVYQLYDQFLQCCYMKNFNFEARCFSIHGSGGKDFKFDDWLKQINNKHKGE